MQFKYENMVEATTDLNKRGYNAQFKLTEDGSKMHCTEMDKDFGPKEMKIIEQHRFEGMSNPSDNSILFVLECPGGCKGAVISSYGTYANDDLIKFMDKVPMRNPEKFKEK